MYKSALIKYVFLKHENVPCVSRIFCKDLDLYIFQLNAPSKTVDEYHETLAPKDRLVHHRLYLSIEALPLILIVTKQW